MYSYLQCYEYSSCSNGDRELPIKMHAPCGLGARPRVLPRHPRLATGRGSRAERACS